MLSRVADNLYWMSRYLERAEHTARVINVQLSLMLERGGESDDRDWARVLRSLGIDVDEESDVPAGQLAQAVMYDAANDDSIVASIMAARENARQVREQIHSEMWEQLNRMFHEVRRTTPEQAWDARDFLQAVKDGSAMFQGLTDSLMTHGEGWRFIQAGRYMERTLSVSKLVSVHFREFNRPEYQEAERAYLEWIGLLRSCTAFEAYCKAYTADLQPERVAEFLVLHPSFPHSIRYSAEALDTAVKEIGREVSSRRSSSVERIAGRMRATLGFGQIDEIMGGGLHAFLEGILKQCAQVHGALYQTYISYPIEAALEV
jgi:uncharacterized alpha-E superfamily protein